ncbi:MAG: pilus assembly protein PilP, partial [Gammaproteobacteria bacterium]
VEDAFGVVHRVSIGNYLGRNFGRITNISETQMNLTEIVPSGTGGWVERPQTLTLQ